MLKIDNLCERICDEELQAFATVILEDNPDFLYLPAAQNHHQNYTGGLYDHTFNVLSVVSGYPEPLLDMDIAKTGAILHDIGKVLCYDFDDEDNIIKTDVDRDLGHFLAGYELVAGYSDLIHPNKMDKIMHIILSHHGNVSNGWGSIVDPHSVEAMVVAYADLMDARVTSFIEENKEG